MIQAELRLLEIEIYNMQEREYFNS